MTIGTGDADTTPTFSELVELDQQMFAISAALAAGDVEQAVRLCEELAVSIRSLIP